ncbi:hypothetical protein BD289DRAFT_359852 [Coniella lustricola]|uniref:Ring-like domain-containing protein n=1 Tax=Coniella lustricola TaxID=2025994 RepID=A0A2T3AKV1_9PEZI|nr:hypothetical protein BD289DRAFT_359852 [Coniella lustricola]
MLEYFAIRRFRKNRDDKVKARQETKEHQELADQKAARSSSPGAQGPVLTDDDELFFERLTGEDGFSDEDGKRPPLPPRGSTPSFTWESDWDSDNEGPATGKGKMAASSSGRHKEKADAATNHVQKSQPGNDNSNNKSRFSFWAHKRPANKKGGDTLAPPPVAGQQQQEAIAITAEEEEREQRDISRVLDDLNLSARNNKIVSLSKESQELVSSFTFVLKDLVNGVPTAGRDLQALFDDHDGTLAKNFEKLPGSLKKLVTSLPTKLTGTLAPELLAVAAESQGIRRDEAAAAGGVKDQAKKLLMPRSISDLVTKPGAIVGMLKAIMNALKTRWPAFIGTNVIWSVALFLLMFVLWYCHKRGREVRLEKEKAAATDLGGHVEENPEASSDVNSPMLLEAPRSPVRFDSSNIEYAMK